MFDFIEVQEDFVEVDHRPAFIFSAVVREDGLNGKAVAFVKRQDPIIEQIDGRLWTLAGVKLTKGQAAVGVH